MADCFKFNISGNHNREIFNKLKFFMTIMFFMSIYYLIINIKKISLIKSIYPPFFDFIDKFNGCIKSENDKKSMSVWYLIFLIIYISLYAIIIVYIYINISGLFNTLGDAVYVFIIMMVFLYIIINRIIFYDQCFVENASGSSSCFTPECAGVKSYYSFSTGECVEDTSSDEPDEPDEPDPSPPSNSNRDNRDNRGKGLVGPVGPSGPPGPPGTNTLTGFIPIIGKKFKEVLKPASNSKNDVLKKDLGLPTEVKEDLTKITEGFALLSNDQKINLKTNMKDVGNESYKASRLMNVLEKYLMKNQVNN